MNDKGAALNERVWRLFWKAGFQTKPNPSDPREEEIELSPGKKRAVDLMAVDEDLGIKIIGWNKARKKLSESLTVHIHDYETLKEIAQADAVLFVSTEKEISEDDKRYAGKLGISIWGEEELRYYEALVDAIGLYAKYEIVHSLGITTKEEKNIHTVLALHLHQPFSTSDEADLFLFTMTPEKLLKICTVLRKARGSAGAYQRILRKKRLKGIERFVTRGDALLLPNLIVHFSENVVWDPVKMPSEDETGKPITLTRGKDYSLVVLRIPLEYASLELIDGQHRLYGFVEAEEKIKKDFNLVVLGIAGLSFERRRDAFISINDKARRVDPNLVAYLKYTDDEEKCREDSELMAIKVVVELSRTTPFKGRIRLIDVGDQPITLKGFSGYDLRGLLGPKGLLRKYYPENESKEYVRALRLYFSIVKNVFKEQWQDPKKYIVCTNRGVSAFLKLLRSMLRTCEGPLEEGEIRKYLIALKQNWEGGWEIQSLRSSYVGSKGWKDFHRDLIKAIQETYPDFRE